MIYQIKDGQSLYQAIASYNQMENEPAVFEFPENGSVVLEGNQMLCSSLPRITGSAGLEIRGNGAVLSADGTGTAIIIAGQNVTVKNLVFDAFHIGIAILATDGDVRNILVSNCTFQDISHECINSGIMGSGLTMDHVTVEECLFIAPCAQRRSNCPVATDFIGACYDEADQALHDIRFSNISWNRNKTCPNEDGSFFAQGLLVFAACNHAFFVDKEMEKSSYAMVENVVADGILAEGNHIEGIHDVGLSIASGIPGRRDILMQNVVYRNNYINYFNTGMIISAAQQIFGGDVTRICTKHVLIEGNTFVPAKPGPYEAQMAIHLLNTRSETSVITCVDCHMEDITVRNNKIYGREIGIAVEAHHGTMDLPYPSNLSDCSIEGLLIENNEFMEMQLPLRIYAANLEGRVGDFWNMGEVKKEMTMPYTTFASNNRINHLCVRGNRFYEYDVAINMAGARVCGHGFAKDNEIGPDIQFSDNTFEDGRKIYSYRKNVSAELLYDNGMGFGNKITGRVSV